MTLHTVFFSGKGTTAICAHCIKNAMGQTNKIHDWLKKPPTAVVDIPAEDALLLAMPVYAGYIPTPTMTMPSCRCAIFWKPVASRSSLQAPFSPSIPFSRRWARADPMPMTPVP